MTNRIFWIAANTVVELVRDRVMQGLAFVGVFLILCGRLIAEMSVVERARMITDVGAGAVFLTGALAVLFAGTNLLDREIRERSALCILSKPVSRSAWLAGKVLGLAAVLCVLIMALTAFLVLFLWAETGIVAWKLFAGGAFLYLMLLIVMGYAVLFSTITSQFMALFFGFLVVIIGHMVDDLKIYWASKAAGAQIVTKLFYYVLPDLKLFSAWRVTGEHSIIAPVEVLWLVLYCIAFLLITLVLASVILERKEFE
jgi:ABC-type transport system involved in multi-copper enzyme maturation permease subunit